MNKEVARRYDVNGNIIKEFDVLKNTGTNEIVLVEFARNNTGVRGLAVTNEIAGIGDWLDVYPDGVFEIVGNAAVSYE